MLTALTAAALLAAPAAFAREGDVEACIGLEEGDDCTRADGDPGFCQSDESDPDVLKCDDDASGTGDPDDGGVECSLTSGRTTPGAALGLSLAAAGLAIVRRRALRRRRAA